MKKFLLPLLLCVSIFSEGQIILKGRVIDDKTKEPLPFVSIAIKNFRSGTTTDIDGHFSIIVPDTTATLLFSYVGFQGRSIVVNKGISFLNVKLKERSTELQEVVVHPSDNPALKIIRHAIENKALNDPDNLSSYVYNSYNNLYSTLVDADSLERKFHERKDSTKNEEDKQDSARFFKFIRDNHLFIHESYTEKKYVRPNFNREVVLGNHLSGIKDPFFAFLATDLQPFSFYKDFISLFGKNYVNPISKGSMSKYDFTLQDTLYHGSDSIFVIAFEPLPGKVFDALKGQLYISNDRYAIEHVLAEPTDDKVLVESKIQQKYEKIDNHWFPTQLNTELRFKKLDLGNFRLKYVSRSYITNIHIGDTISKKEFGLANVEFSPEANRRDSTYWNEHRTGSFDTKDRNTFHALDSIGGKLAGLQSAFKILEGLFVGRFRVGSFYLPSEYLVRFNQYEGVRLGFGFQTGEKISKRFMLEGYGGYGTRDHALKYGGAFQFNLNERYDIHLKFSYQRDVSEPGKQNFLKAGGSINGNESLRSWMTSRMDSVEQFRTEFQVRPFHFSQLSIFLQEQKRNPTYPYSFTNDVDGSTRTQFDIAEAGLQWRFAFRETYTQIGQSKIITNTAYPQFNIYVSHGFPDFLNGQYQFNKVEVRFDHQFITRGFGKTTLQVNSGVIDGQAPNSVLFNGKGSKFSESVLNNIVVNNTFQTMGLYEFISDRYASLFLQHNFGRLTGNKSRLFRPELSVVHNMGIGSLNKPANHTGIAFNTMEKGFYESGIVVSNIFRISYVDLVYFGFGVGGFYRYGNYSLPNSSDNAVFKLVFNISL